MSCAPRSLGVVLFPAFDWAISPTHPEREERLLYTWDQLREEGLFDIPGITEYKTELATAAHIERVHFCWPDVDDVCTPSHYASAGGAIRAGRMVLDATKDRAFALVRPPGHHAMRVTHGNRGFCNVNIEAIMVEYLRDHFPKPDGSPLRVAIVDTDCHHGDGSQDIFWNDPHTLFVSLHQDGRTLYPGTGFAHENGGPAALGRTVNIPLPPETGDAGYLYVMQHAVMPLLADFAPDIIVNSAGQDNHFTDPLANMRLTAQGYAALNTLLNPHIAVLEGGYAIRGALPYVNLAICLALAGLAYDDIVEPQWNAQMQRTSALVGGRIERICEDTLNIYYTPPKTPSEGQREGDYWVRERSIFYDTDMLRENQREAYRLCPHCEGLLRIDTGCSRTRHAVCLRTPRHACEHCRSVAQDMEYEAKRKNLPVRWMDMDAHNIAE